MTWEIAAVLLILAAALALFVWEKPRMDVVALLVLTVLGTSGLVSPREALAGFSNPVVVTVWSMFILSAGLSATGVADLIGRRVERLAGTGEARMILVIMLTTGGLSAFMNNIGVAALMLPVVMDLARRADISPSRLLMPMAFGSLLGGMTTLIGNSPNLLASNALRQAGHGGFALLDFTPVGVPALLVGSLFVAFAGRHLLPRELPEALREAMRQAGGGIQFAHDLAERRFRLRVADGSAFDGRPLAGTGLAALLGLNVHTVTRRSESLSDIDGSFVLRSGDILHVLGRVEELAALLRWRAFEMAQGAEIGELLLLQKLALVSAELPEDCNLAGLTVREADFRRRFHAHILTVRRGDRILRDNLAELRLAAGDRLQLELRRDRLDALRDQPHFTKVELIAEESLGEIYSSSETLMELDIPADSHLDGRTVAESGLWDSLRLRIVGIARRGGSVLFPAADEKFRSGDKLLVHGRRESLELMRALQGLEWLKEDETAADPTVPDDTGYTEVTLSPRSALAGRSLKELDFRRRYGLQVLSIWRRGRAYRSYLRHLTLEFGDALLLFGRRERLRALAEDPDFLVLSRSAYETKSQGTPRRTWLAAGIMLAVVVLAAGGVLPISLAALAGAAAMIATGCLGIDDAYRAIEWKSVCLIACMIPLGTAMESTGAAAWIAGGMAAVAAPYGPWAMIAGLYVLTAMAATVVPTTALVVIMSVIGIDAAIALDLPPQMVVLAIAMAASASFTSPIAHPVNLLVMGPGGYRFADYVKLGLLLAIVAMAVVLPMIALTAGRW